MSGSTLLSETLTTIQSQIDNWISDDGGRCVVAFSMNHFWEHLMQADSSALGVLCYAGETIANENGEVVGLLRRHFVLGIRRNRGYKEQPGKKLTDLSGPVRPFADVLEEGRDTVRFLQLPAHLQIVQPVEYESIEPFESQSRYVDCYIIHFSILTQLSTMVSSGAQAA